MMESNRITSNLSGFSPHLFRLWKTNLVLVGFTGIMAFFFSMQNPAQVNHSTLLGYSSSQIVVSGLILLALAGIIVVSIIRLRQGRVEVLIEQIHEYLIGRNNLVAVTFFAVFLLLGALIPDFLNGFLIKYLDPANLVFVLIRRVSPILFWIAAVAFQTLCLWIILYRKQYLSSAMWKRGSVLQVIFCAVTSCALLAHWFMLALQIPILVSIPGWYWGLTRAAFSAWDLLLVIGLLLTLWGVYALRHTPEAYLQQLGLLLIMGCLLPIGFGLAEGKGYEGIRQKFTSSLHRSYVAVICTDQVDLLGIVREYNQRYGTVKVFMRTKPPGVLLTYKAIQNLLNISPQSDRCFDRITSFIAYVFPLIGCSVVIGVFLFFRQFSHRRDAWLPSLLIITAPNFVLIPLFLDQVLYPFLFLISCLLIFQVIRSRSFWLALVAGIALYLVIFMSFSMLPLLALTFIALIIDFWLKLKPARLWENSRMLITMIAGFILVLILFRVLLNYDVFLRFNISMQQVNYDDYYLKTGALDQYGAPESWSIRINQVVDAFLVNNLELATSSGIAMFSFFLVGSAGVTYRIIRRKTEKGDFEFGCMLAAYLAMNVYGQTRGEVARLWLFWIPMLAFLASKGIMTLFKDKPWVVYILIIAQFLTIVMLFKFQGFKV